jgi:hypothetical protein
MGAGPLVGEMRVCAQSVVGASVAGVRAWGVTGMPTVRGQVTTSLFDGVTVGLGSRSGWEGVAGRPGSGHVGSGLATRGATSPLNRVTAGGAVGAGVCARGATLALGRGMTGSGSVGCSDAVT